MRLYNNHKLLSCAWVDVQFVSIVTCCLLLSGVYEHDYSKDENQQGNSSSSTRCRASECDSNHLSEDDRISDKRYEKRVHPTDSNLSALGYCGSYRQSEDHQKDDKESIGIVVGTLLFNGSMSRKVGVKMAAETTKLENGVRIESGKIIIIGDVNKDLPISSTGKSLSLFNKQGMIDDLQVDGKSVRLNCNATIKNPAYVKPTDG